MLGLNAQTFGPDLTATIGIQSMTNGVAPGNPVSTLTITRRPGPAVSLAISRQPDRRDRRPGTGGGLNRRGLPSSVGLST